METPEAEELTAPRGVWEHLTHTQIVDVRETWEYAAGHIEGAMNITLGELMAGGTSQLNPEIPVVLVCKSGNRSELAALMLQTRGYDGYNLDGGMEAWAAQGLPFTNEEGQAGRVA